MIGFDDLFKGMRFKNEMERSKLVMFFNEYMTDIPANFYLDQFELQAKYPGSTYLEWLALLTHEPFNVWKATQINMIAQSKVDKALAGSDDITDRETMATLKTRKEILDAAKEVAKDTFVVLPEALWLKGEDDD